MLQSLRLQMSQTLNLGLDNNNNSTIYLGSKTLNRVKPYGDLLLISLTSKQLRLWPEYELSVELFILWLHMSLGSIKCMLILIYKLTHFYKYKILVFSKNYLSANIICKIHSCFMCGYILFISLWTYLWLYHNVYIQ